MASAPTHLTSRLAPTGAGFAANRAAMLALVERLRSLEARTRTASAASAPRFEKRRQVLPRDRLALLLDPGAPFLELATLAGYLRDQPSPERSTPGGNVICGIGHVSGTRAMVVASDSGIEAGAMNEAGAEKALRAQRIALSQKLPFVHLVESAGANLLRYRVEHFVRGGAIFANLARLSAAGCPVITVVHGSSTAGGAYLPGLSDYVVMVRGRARAYLAGPPLLRAATGEVASDEELGGAEMHAAVSGLAEYLAEDDAEAIGIARRIVAALDWEGQAPPPLDGAAPPRHPADDLLGIMPVDPRTPVDMREVIARVVDGSEFLEFKAAYGPATVTGHAAITGQRVGILTNNGPLDPPGASKATHFIQACCQSGTPLLFLHNTTGFIVGRDAEQRGMIKHGSKMIQAVTTASVPRITLHCGASFGAGNYGMCGRGYDPDFLFAWPNARTAVMGGEQAAATMAMVMAQNLERRGQPVDQAQMAAMKQMVIDTFEGQMDAFTTSGLGLDDGVIDPRDTRPVLALVLAVCRDAGRRRLRPLQFGVARP